MRFEGKLTEHYPIDHQAYNRDRNLFGHSTIVLFQDYQDKSRGYFVAKVTGKFGDDFCSGADPLHIKEYPDRPEVKVDLEICSNLIERLEKDGQTSGHALKVLENVLELRRQKAENV